MQFTRRDLGRIALASVPLRGAFGAKRINSTFGGVRIGAITYSFNRIASPDPEAIVKAYVEIGLGEAELMSNHCEALAGAPPMPAGPGGRGTPPTPEQQADGRPRWRNSPNGAPRPTPTPGRPSPGNFNAAGVRVTLLCYNMQDSMKDADIEYGFRMAKGLGVKGMTTSTTISMSKRIATGGGPAQAAGRLSRPRRHQRPQPDRHVSKSYATLMSTANTTASTWISATSPPPGTTPSRSSSSTTIRSPTCTSRIARRTMAPTWPCGARATHP